MGSTGDYQSMGSGPAGVDLLNAPAFENDTEYLLEFTVARTNEVGVIVTLSITGGGTNWTHTAADAAYNYHRFDAVGIRPATLETTANWLEIAEFKVEVLSVAQPQPDPIPLVLTGSSTNLVLTWSDPAFKLQASPQASSGYTDVPGATSPYPVNVGTGQMFYRLKWQ
jgi:hypothetical protein